ncbi:MAG: GNAT family N-acetyltransferase [Bacteroidota bacterium]
MTIRDLQPADADALLALWNRSAPYDPMTPDLLAEKIWQEPNPGPRLVATSASGEVWGVSVGAMWGPPNESRGTIKMLAVAPEKRRQGIGGALLSETEAGLAALGAETLRIAECSPNYLVPGVDLRYTPGWLFVQKHGYTSAGEAVNMHVNLLADEWDTSEKERDLDASGVEVRRATEADRGGVMAMLAENWPAWQPEIANTFAQQPVSLHLALRTEAVLGFSAYDANNRSTGWFGPMGTAPEARGLGIGGVLCRRCLRDLAAQGQASATIPWVAPVGFYAHYAGAHVSRVFHRFEKTVG